MNILNFTSLSPYVLIGIISLVVLILGIFLRTALKTFRLVLIIIGILGMAIAGSPLKVLIARFIHF